MYANLKWLLVLVAVLGLVACSGGGGGGTEGSNEPRVMVSVTATAGSGGTVIPTIREVRAGSTAAFTVTPDSGYVLNPTMGGTAPAGSWDGNLYTTGAVSEDATVVFSFSQERGTVPDPDPDPDPDPALVTIQASAGSGGTVTPSSREVNAGSTAAFTVTPDTGYVLDLFVGGTAPAGTWNGNLYTTGVVSENATVSFSFTRERVTVTASASIGGTVSPLTREVDAGNRAAFTVAPDSGYVLNPSVGGTAPAGIWNGNLYTTGTLARDATVIFSFAAERTVTASAGDGGSVTPTQQVVGDGMTATFAVHANTGRYANQNVGGTCSQGNWSQGQYTTGVITQDCSVSFLFSSTRAIPDTGQATCYNLDGSVLNPCPQPGGALYGQDAQYQGTPRSYTKLDASGGELAATATSWVMVRDNVTGLYWEVKTQDNSGHDRFLRYTWEQTTANFIPYLNSTNFGGFSDWRMPTRKELATLSHFGGDQPTIDYNYFPNTRYDVGFWTSTGMQSDTNRAWMVDFGNGDSDGAPKTDRRPVRAVRGGL